MGFVSDEPEVERMFLATSIIITNNTIAITVMRIAFFLISFILSFLTYHTSK